MLFLIFFIIQLFNVTPEKVQKVSEMSMEKPIFIYFLIYGCPDCQPYFPIWKEIVKKYDNNDNFILAEADCRIHRILRKIYQITWVPSFLTIYKNQSHLEYIESSIESMEKVISKIDILGKSNIKQNITSNDANNEHNFTQSYDETSPVPTDCQKIGKMIVNFPSFVIGNQFSNPCQKVLEYKQKYPNLKNNFYYTDNNETKGYIALRPSKIFQFENNIYSNDFDSFIHEFTFSNGGDWDLRETSNLSRRIAFFIYKIPDQISSYHSFMNNHDTHILFGKIHYDAFHKLFPSVYLNNRMIPALAISNMQKTKFTILNNRRGYNRLIRNIISGKSERLMKNSLKPIYPNITNENGMLVGLTIMSFCVIFLTFFIIFRRAKQCIDVNRSKPLKSNSFL